MAQASALLEEEDEDDENLSLLNIFQENLQFLKQVPLHRIPDRLKFEAAALYFGTSDYEYEWRGVLEDLGVDHITLYGLDFKSSKTGILPIYLALNGVLKNNRSFGDFIDVLCERKKFHILRTLAPFVKELLSKQHSLNEESSDFGPRPSAPDFSDLEVTGSLADSCGSAVNSSTQLESGCNTLTCQDNRVKHVNDHKTTEERLQNSEAISSVNKKRLSPTSNFQSNQSIDVLNSVFIMHSMVDKKYAKKLATSLLEKNFRVITSANIYYYLRENPTMIMKLIDERVDFVIIVITKSFMQQIKITSYNDTEEKDIESVANTFMYDRLLNEYSSQGNFLNRRVRPVCYSLESRKIKTNDQILSWPCYLPYSYLRDNQLLERELLRFLRRS